MIRATELTRRFGDFLAVDRVSFDIPRGEIFAFLGPNGAGKTTTIRMLTTLLAPSSGTMELDGIDVVRDPHAARRRFGIVFQDSTLDLELTARENMTIHGVLYGMRRRDIAARSEALLRLFELWDRRDDVAKNYSGGMRRRLEIARSLLHTPRVIFLDEPTLGLDPQTRNQLWTHVRRLNEEESVTVFLTTHYMEEAERVAHRIAVIDHGRIIAQDTAAGLKAATGTQSLEQAFLAFTGTAIRAEEAAGNEQMRRMARVMRRG
jgi:ABC-2 type transport system ATP-binding protein